MNFEIYSRRLFWFPVIASLCLALLSHVAAAHEIEQKIPDPGYRPECENAQTFLEMLDTATVAVLPSIVRRADRTAHSFDSQQLVIALLNDDAIVSAVPKPKRIDRGPLHRISQWEVFNYGLDSVASGLEGYDTGADFSVVVEILVPDNQEVFGIEVYILDNQGRNAFSFLLNSHHEMFSEANLRAKNSSEKARAAMIRKATKTAIAALQRQIDQARADAAIEGNVTGYQPVELKSTLAG